MSAFELRAIGDNDELKRVIELEEASFPDDEAASPDTLRYRCKHAADYFRAYFLKNSNLKELVGFVNGTLSSGDKLNGETMSNHDVNGTMLCVHGVVVAERHRRQGIGLAMMRAYVRDIEARCSERLASIRLLCKQHLIEFYQSVGFQLLGKSDVEHGQDQWFEMVKYL
jgi:predicted GNAT family N-acyltransferase